MLPGIALLPQQQKQEDTRDVVQPDKLHQERQPAAEPGHEQPSAIAGVEIANHRRCTEDRQKQVVPGRHGRRIVRHAPEDRERRHPGCHQGRSEPGREEEHRRHPDDEGPQQDPPHRHERAAEPAEGQGVHVGQPAGVHFVEVPVRQLAGIEAVGGLEELAFVVGDPAAVDRRVSVERGGEPDGEECAVTS